MKKSLKKRSHVKILIKILSIDITVNYPTLVLVLFLTIEFYFPGYFLLHTKHFGFS